MGLFTKVFGTYSQRELKSIYPIVDKITALEEDYKKLTDAELQAKTPEFKARLAQGERIVEILKQNRNSPIDVELQVCIIYAVTKNLLTDVPVARIRDYEAALFEYLKVQRPAILESIRDTKELTKTTEEELRQAIEVCKEQFVPKE